MNPLNRKTSPHTIPGSIADRMNTVAVNTGRFAEVWLDEYKEFYYRQAMLFQ